MAASAAAAISNADSAQFDLEATVQRVAANKQAWLRLSPKAKLELLRQIRANTERLAEPWANTSAAIRGVAGDGPTPHMEGTAWFAGAVMTGSALGGLIRSFTRLAKRGRVAAPPNVRARASGQRVVTVYPTTLLDKGYTPGYRGELWLEPGATGSQGKTYADAEPALCAILGAGNYEAPIDVLTKMFCENHVVIYKPNPVNNASAAIVGQILKPLIDAGYLAIVPSDIEIATALLAHAAVDEALMTGGCATYNHIVWGAPAQQAANKTAGRKQMDKPFVAELGGAAPVIIVPGKWTDAEIDHYAAHIAAAKVLNGAHVCASPQVLVVAAGWNQRQKFLERVRYHLRKAPADPSFYPGAAARQQQFKDAYPQAELLGPKEHLVPGQLDRLLIANAGRDSLAAHQEAFCPVLAEVALPETDPREFLAAATRFCNNELFGSLSATLLVDPRTDKALGDGVEEAVANLEYGSIGVNVWGAMIVFFCEMSWGAYPKHTPEDIQSGQGQIGNTYMVDGCQKAVLWSPFVSPVHAMPGRPRDKKVGPRIGRFMLRPSVGRLAKVMSAAMLGI